MTVTKNQLEAEGVLRALGETGILKLMEEVARLRTEVRELRAQLDKKQEGAAA